MPGRILVVDDDDVALFGVTWFLREEGYLVEEARDGTWALERLKKQRFDLVITDVRMPQVDGLALLEQLSSRAPGTPVVLMTGDAAFERAAAISRGAREILFKPLDMGELLRTVKDALRAGRGRTSSRPAKKLGPRTRA
ncbi:MAG TPA: response regulator [Candidatus Acidoferrales bacterium]|nr:response regulator [Candidatus Acidoferrales bacterium]